MARVLVFDENKHVRMLYALELAAEGYEVVLAADEEEAMERMRTVQPDLVVMDIWGIRHEVRCETAKALKEVGKVPLIINTSHELPEEWEISSFADACLTKSSDFSELKDKIRELLSQSNHREEREVFV